MTETRTVSVYDEHRLFFAGIAVLIAAFAGLMLLGSEDAEAAHVGGCTDMGALPSSAVTFTVLAASNVCYTGGNMAVTTVDVYGTLVVEQATIRFANYGNIHIRDNAKLTLTNVSMNLQTPVAAISPYWTLTSYSLGDTKIYDSKLTSMYMANVQGPKFWLENSYVTRSYYGVYLYLCQWSWCSGAGAFNNNGPTVINNQFYDKYYAVYIQVYSVNSAVKVTVKNNMVLGSQQYGVYFYNYGSPNVQTIFTGNTVLNSQGTWGGTGVMIYYPGTKLTFDNNIIMNNKANGVYIYDWTSGGAGPPTIPMNNNILLGNSPDLYLYNVKVTAKTNTVGKITVQGTGRYEIGRTVDVRATWQSNNAPVVDAEVMFTDRQGLQTIAANTTDANGEVTGIVLPQIVVDSTGQKIFTPYALNVTKGFIKAQATFALTQDVSLAVVLDDVPPAVLIASPATGTLTNKDSITVRGVTDPDAAVLVNGIGVGVDRFGGYEATLPIKADGDFVITVQGFDEFMNTATRTVTIKRDTVLPTLTISVPNPATTFLVASSTIDVTGTVSDAVSGAAVTVLVNDLPVSVSGSGGFSSRVVLDEGKNVILVEARDQAGNSVSTTLTGTSDTEAPDLAVFDPVNGFRTREPQVTLQGSSEKGAKVRIATTEIPLSQDTFSIPVTLQPGENVITITSTDRAGNVATLEWVVIRDESLPTITIDEPRAGGITNQRRIVVSGTTNAREVQVNGIPLATYNPGSGSYLAFVSLKEGRNEIRVAAYDDLGNGAGATTFITLDTLLPALAVESPEDGLTTNEAEIDVEGVAEDGATVWVKGLPQGEPGSFQVAVPLSEGLNILPVKAMDRAGNARTVVVTVTRDSQLSLTVRPMDPTTTKSTVTVLGTTDPDAKVFVNAIPAKVDATGQFSVDVDLSEGVNEILVRAEDPVKNTKATTLMVVRKVDSGTAGGNVLNPTGRNNAVTLDTILGVFAIVMALIGVGVAYAAASRRRRIKEIRARKAAMRPIQPVFMGVAGGGMPGQAGLPGGTQLALPPPPPGAPGGMPVGAPAYGGGFEPALLALPPPPPGVAGAPPAAIPPPPPAGPVTPAASSADGQFASLASSLDARLTEAEANGADTKKARNSLRMAQFFRTKGDGEKARTYLEKTLEETESLEG